MQSEAKSLRILIVDDLPIVGRALAAMLGRLADVTLETDASTALERIERGEIFDLILCDVEMPRMDGPEFFERVLARAPELRDVFAFISGGSSSAIARRLQATGRPCLQKPVLLADVLEVAPRLAAAERPRALR
jgi:CheY-like chemotaxis protein